MIGRQNMRQWRAAMVGARSHAWTTRQPFTEHVACVAVPDLESIFRIIHMDSDLGACTKVVAL